MKKKVAIASLFTALTPSLYSHGSGFARIFSAQLHHAGIEHEILWSADKRDWKELATIYLYQGLDLNGKLSINMFGGQCEQNAVTLRKLAEYYGDIHPINYSLLPYHELRKRDWSGTTTNINWAHLEWWNEKGICRRSKNPNTSRHITIGDSHAPSVWAPGDHIEVLSGWTLHKFCNLSEDELVQLVGDHDQVTLYFGQIDVRHHLCRQPFPVQAAEELARKYSAQVRILMRRKISVWVCELHPIEDESRQIPTPGRYKGTNFYGSWADRNECRLAINEFMFKSAKSWGYQLHRYPAGWIDAEGKMNQEYMERPRSVHIAPKYYRGATMFDV